MVVAEVMQSVQIVDTVSSCYPQKLRSVKLLRTLNKQILNNRSWDIYA